MQGTKRDRIIVVVLCAVVMMVTGCGDGGGGEKESEAKTYEEAIAETHAITDDTSGCLPPAIKFRGKIYISRRDYQKELGEDVDCSELWDVGKVERSIENGTALSGKDEDYTANYADMVGETIYLRENGNLVIKNDIGASEYYIEGQDETYHDLYLSEQSDKSCLVKTKTIKRKDDHFDYDIEYPYITPAQGEKNYDSVNKLIEDTVLEKTGYAEVERESDEEKQERKLYIKLDYKIRKLSHRILSVSFEGFYSEKNAIHPINLDFCFNYNLESDSEICLSNVVPDMEYVDKAIEIGRKKGYFIRKASVFCTPSIALEYVHLDEIKSFDTDLIEMETSSFYLMTDLFELPGIALLVVSDNSANGAALVGRTEEQQQQYDYGKRVVLPDMIIALAAE